MSFHRILFPGLKAGFFALAIFGASAASAQSVITTSPTAAVASSLTLARPADSTAVSASAAARVSAPAGFQSVSTEPRALTMRQDESMGVGRNVAMMGVGAAGLIAGLLIGGSSGTVIAVGSGVIGLLGLYRFLQ